ncbi:hypothetical protein EP7_002013 [Isosphaeraceae bacterium EP7]
MKYETDGDVRSPREVLDAHPNAIDLVEFDRFFSDQALPIRGVAVLSYRVARQVADPEAMLDATPTSSSASPASTTAPPRQSSRRNPRGLPGEIRVNPPRH